MSTSMVVFPFLELGPGKEGVCLEEGLSMEYVSWSGIWRMSSVEGRASYSE